MRRIVGPLIALLISVSSVASQTSNNLRRVLGKRATEVYKVEPNLSVTVNYDARGQVCDIQLTGNYLSAQTFANKLLPVGSRGRLVGPPIALVVMDCCQSFAYEYEKVTMITSQGLDGPSVRYVFKSTECEGKQPGIHRHSAGRTIGQIQSASKSDLSSDDANRIYRKYETTAPAVILELPAPELTSEAIAQPELGEMIIEAVLESSGKVTNLTQRGYLKNGMTDRVLVAARKIKFRPALLGSKPVSQHIYIKYSVQKCDGDKLCTGAEEILEP